MEEIARYVPVVFILGGYFAYFYYVKPKLEQRKRDAVDNRAPAAPAVDSTAARLATPEERAVLTALAARNLGPLVQHLSSLRQGRWDERALVCGLVEKTLDRELLNARSEAEPGQGIHFLLRGHQAKQWAWQARGHGGADDVSDRSAHRFEERMGLAERDLHRAAELDPEDPTPHATLVAVVPHLTRPEVAGERCLTEALRRDPEHYGALSNYLTYFCAPHWGGSPEQALAFARKNAASAAPGSLRHLLVAEAHYDVWHNESAFGDAKKAAAYVDDPRVREEVFAAYAASLGNPSHVPSRRTAELRNLAAWWFFMTRERERCAAELARIGGAHTESFWKMLGPAEPQFAAVTAWAVKGKKWKLVGY